MSRPRNLEEKLLAVAGFVLIAVAVGLALRSRSPSLQSTGKSENVSTRALSRPSSRLSWREMEKGLGSLRRKDVDWFLLQTRIPGFEAELNRAAPAQAAAQHAWIGGCHAGAVKLDDGRRWEMTTAISLEKDRSDVVLSEKGNVFIHTIGNGGGSGGIRDLEVFEGSAALILEVSENTFFQLYPVRDGGMGRGKSLSSFGGRQARVWGYGAAFPSRLSRRIAAVNRIEVTTELPMDYSLREPVPGSARELILLLHGYGESGSRILSKLEAALPKDAIVLAPNGPFPFTEKREERYRLAYSWYLYDFQSGEYVIDMKPALGFLRAGVEKLGYSALPLRIIGFSQGGYLAPFVGERLPQTRQVILLQSTYLHEELGPRLAFRTDNIVGSEDTVVDPQNSRRSHAEILKRSRGGEFISLEGLGHRIDTAVVRKTAELLQRIEV